MLDLQPGVDLEEGDRAVLADEELAGPGADVAGLAQDRLGRRAELRVLLRGQVRRGGLLDQLLVAALQRAVPGGDDDHGAVGVGEALGFHVPGPVEVALDEALAAAEGADGLADRRLVQFRDLGQRAGDLQAAAAAAERRLDRDRQAVLLGERDDLRRAGHGIGGAGHQRRAGPLGDLPGGDLVAEVADGLRRRADPGQPGVEHRLGEVGVLRQEPVAGVDGVGTGLRGGREDLADVQVAGGGGVAAERERLVGGPDVRRVPVRVGVDRDAGEAGVPAGPGDADRDLAPVGDEDLRYGHAITTLTGVPDSDGRWGSVFMVLLGGIAQRQRQGGGTPGVRARTGERGRARECSAHQGEAARVPPRARRAAAAHSSTATHGGELGGVRLAPGHADHGGG